VTVKCYTGNYDGTREGLIVAENQKRAAEVAGCSLYAFRQFWHQAPNWPDQRIRPHTLYTRLYSARYQGEWTEGRVANDKAHLQGRSEKDG
jgi:hypothetical protein